MYLDYRNTAGPLRPMANMRSVTSTDTPCTAPSTMTGPINPTALPPGQPHGRRPHHSAGCEARPRSGTPAVTARPLRPMVNMRNTPGK